MINRAFWLFIAIPSTALVAQPTNWLEPITLDAQTAQPSRDIAASDFFEIAASKKHAAEEMLKSSAAVSVGGAEIDYFGQRNFRCTEGKNPYLVRASFMNGATGDFVVKRFGTSLLIGHGSLGAATAIERTALVVCLDFQPSAVYSSISGAM